MSRRTSRISGLSMRSAATPVKKSTASRAWRKLLSASARCLSARARCSLASIVFCRSPTRAALVFDCSRAISSVLVKSPAEVRKSIATADSASPRCRRVHLTALSRRLGGRARIGSSRRNRRRSSASAPAVA